MHLLSSLVDRWLSFGSERTKKWFSRPLEIGSSLVCDGTRSLTSIENAFSWSSNWKEKITDQTSDVIETDLRWTSRCIPLVDWIDLDSVVQSSRLCALEIHQGFHYFAWSSSLTVQLEDQISVVHTCLDSFVSLFDTKRKTPWYVRSICRAHIVLVHAVIHRSDLARQRCGIYIRHRSFWSEK